MQLFQEADQSIFSTNNRYVDHKLGNDSYQHAYIYSLKIKL